MKGAPCAVGVNITSIQPSCEVRESERARERESERARERESKSKVNVR